MSLKKYIAKRKFDKTPEPKGTTKAKKAEHIFVVQKHHASHLHYDFRLEMEGVLKSWAVPKGPSMNPEDKRLAMMVEDHPYSYKDFEGNIPEGNYGAGNVIVWDNGTYESAGNAEDEKALLAALYKGHLNIVLKGKKLKGEFSLVKLKNGKQENAWLLIKKNDRYASEKDVTEKDKSVISSITLEKLATKYGNEKTGQTSATKKPAIKPRKKSSTPPQKKAVKKKPTLIKPMLAKLADKPFDNPEWVFEIKYDGYRALANCDGDGNVELYSRNLLSFNQDFGDVVTNLEGFTHSCILDGEVVIEDEKGRSHFQLLQNYQREKEGQLKYYVFDILQLEGKDVTSLPLLKRKELLTLLLQKEKPTGVFYSDHIEEKGVMFYKQAQKLGLEGIMAKDAGSAYYPATRSSNWLKIKITKEQEAVIAGITEPRGSRKRFGSIVLAVYTDGELDYIGHCGTGFDDKMLDTLYNKCKPLFIKKSPFNERIPLKRAIQWVRPKLVCHIKFAEWTSDGVMRHPVFIGLRKDKKATEVIREIPDKMKKTKTKQAKGVNEKTTSLNYEIKVNKVNVHLTNQNKLYWPDEGITKGDLINYYKEIAPVILPYLKDRPQSLHRFPNGIKDAGFYQKDMDTKQIPGWVVTEKVYSESNKEHLDYLICNNKETLLYMANLGCIEINPWNSRIQKPENPDWLVIDLDPEDISFKEVVNAARETKSFFDALELDCYCKTSGATGLHIYVPLGAKYDYEVAKTFAQLTAQRVNEILPETTSIVRMPAKRKKKVYLDFLQNRRAQTLASPYSVRPKPGATVSTPLEWSEVNARLDPTKFTIKTTLKRLDKKGDLWKPVLGKGVNLNKAILKIYEESINT